MSDKPPVDKIITSTMVRVQQTANIIHQKFASIPLEKDKALQEGSPEQAHTVERFEQMLLKYFVPTITKLNVIVCHTNVIRFLACTALGIDTGKCCKMTIPHCSITAITILPS